MIHCLNKIKVFFFLTFCLVGLFLLVATWRKPGTVSADNLSLTRLEKYEDTLVPQTPCVAGSAGGFPCFNVDLLAHLPLSVFGAEATGNDIWGWTDPLDGREYALYGVDNGTVFVDITTPEAPVYLGKLPSHTSGRNTWRDIKQYANHAYIVSEAAGHGLQIFDLTQLRNLTNTVPITFTETAHYDQIDSAHNIAINEESGFAYAVGSNTCNGGLHMINIQTPTNPTFAGCFSADGDTHDAQCVNYQGPDEQHQGQEICFNANEDTLTIVDVTSKTNPQQISRMGYIGSGYAHQGWLTEDQRYFLLDDERDEIDFLHNTKTYIWDVSDLDNPHVIGTHLSHLPSSDHNLYVKGNFVYEANYKSGLRILEMVDVANGYLVEVAYLDTFPADNTRGFAGAWSSYPFFDSGVVIIGDYNGGLFIVRPHLSSFTDFVFFPFVFSQ